MHRVDVEDFKGLEVVLLLSAAVIKDIFFNASREMFNISSPNTTPSGSNRKRNNSGPVIRESRSNSSPTMSGGMTPSLPARTQTNPNGPSPVNPRTQWEIDAETARLKALVEAEERERQRAEALEEQRIKQMLENEEKERRRREAEIAKETERLRKQYGRAALETGARAEAAEHAGCGATWGGGRGV
ncbi:Reticulocyte-binding 2 like a protein [Rutstroemia sp. NJR-2017a BBW]|nr:Reticulocyte-binding 2 like a protein [Rutstroemia sp. NJR-2017a BBW]